MKQANKILLILTDIFRTVFDDTSIDLSKNTTSADIEEWDSLNQIKIILFSPVYQLFIIIFQIIVSKLLFKF